VVQGPYHGHAGVREWVSDAFDVINDRRFELEEAIDSGDGETVVTVQRALGHSTHTGLKFDLSWAAVWTIRSGKVVRIQGYLTKGAALEAVGLRE
jgi:ketosteroid isomerase-like protein